MKKVKRNQNINDLAKKKTFFHSFSFLVFFCFLRFLIINYCSIYLCLFAFLVFFCFLKSLKKVKTGKKKKGQSNKLKNNELPESAEKNKKKTEKTKKTKMVKN